MLISFNDSLTEQKIGQLKPKHLDILFGLDSMRAEKRRLFNGSFDEAYIKMDWFDDETHPVYITFKESGKPGYLIKTYSVKTVELVRMDWISHPVLNRSGLASLIWDDKKPNDLRRRLENRVKFMSFSDEEKNLIIQRLEEFVEDVRKSLNY